MENPLNMDSEDFSGFLVKVVCLFCLVIGLIWSGYAIIQAMRTDGRIDYCYASWTQSSGPIKGYWDLYGHRSWRPDEKIGSFTDQKEAVESAKLHNCELNVVKP